MIKKLQRNFIIVAMSSIFVVLVVLIGALNVISYIDLIHEADAVLDILAENDARFPKGMNPADMTDREEPPTEESSMDTMPAEDMNPEHDKKPFGFFDKREPMSVETPYETRFFTVKVDDNGTVITVDTGKIAAIETEDAIDYAEEIWESGKKKGFIDNYRYRMVTRETDTMIIFVDRTREIASFRTLMRTSVSVSILGMAAVYMLVFIFSRKVFRPVETSYQKQKQFITDASHELKTPITIISANVELLEMEGEENDWTKSIKHQVERLTSLTEQMVTLSRMDEEQNEKMFQHFDLSRALHDTADLFTPLAHMQAKELQIEIQDGWMYYGDEKQIRQMVSLLLDNAVKYSAENGKIVFSVKPKGKKYQMTIWNTVDEIQTGELDMLFERFYRLDSSRSSQTGGSGIGLSIVKAIVESHGGRIHAESKDGKSITIEAII